ncbi:MAG TPA: DUF6719 family protein [Afipia sp.]
MLACCAWMIFIVPARADMVTRESEITGIRLGQHILVDDGSCPAGQIKEITGTKLSAQGVATIRKCVDRKTARR